jgi:hypothetical protein
VNKDAFMEDKVIYLLNHINGGKVWRLPKDRVTLPIVKPNNKSLIPNIDENKKAEPEPKVNDNRIIITTDVEWLDRYVNINIHNDIKAVQDLVLQDIMTPKIPIIGSHTVYETLFKTYRLKVGDVDMVRNPNDDGYLAKVEVSLLLRPNTLVERALEEMNKYSKYTWNVKYVGDILKEGK